ARAQNVVSALRWPDQLPTPGPANRAPLVLPLRHDPRREDDLLTAARVWRESRIKEGRIASTSPVDFVVPIGRFDRPVERLQGVSIVDLHGYEGKLEGGAFLVAGDLSTGKTTTLQTLV